MALNLILGNHYENYGSGKYKFFKILFTINLLKII